MQIHILINLCLCLLVDGPQVQTCPDHYSGVEHGFSLDMLSCQADGNPPPTIEWSYQGGMIHASEPLNRTHSGNYTAEFENAYGISLASVNITIECEFIRLV